MISGLRIKYRKNGEVLSLFTPGHGQFRARWITRYRRRYPHCLHLHDVYFLMALQEFTNQ